MKLDNLKKLRIKAHIKQKEIANYLHISIAGYSLYERGEREPSIEILIKLADYYQVSIDYLVGRKELAKNE